MLTPTKGLDSGERAASWLRRKYPRHAAKELQRALELELRTAKRVLAGDISHRVMGMLIGEYGGEFLKFVYADHLNQDRLFWITEEGIESCPQGHGLHVRDVIGLPHHCDTDPVRYGLSHLGWIKVVVSVSGIEIEHADSVEIEALERIPEFLSNYPGSVSINGEACSDPFTAVQRAIVLSGAREAQFTAQWAIERKPLDSIKTPGLAIVVREFHKRGDHSRHLPQLLLDTGSLPTSSLIHVKGDAFRPLWTGTKLGVDPSETLGIDIRDRADKKYASLVIAHLRECMASGPTFYDLSIQINGQRERYKRVALPSRPNPDGSRLIATTVERLAA